MSQQSAMDVFSLSVHALLQRYSRLKWTRGGWICLSQASGRDWNQTCVLDFHSNSNESDSQPPFVLLIKENKSLF